MVSCVIGVGWEKGTGFAVELDMFRDRAGPHLPVCVCLCSVVLSVHVIML